MEVNAKGLALTQSELNALLEFGHRNPDDRLWSIQFVLQSDRVKARATDGKRAVEAQGDADGSIKGEWLVARDFLVAGRKMLSGSQRLRLMFSGATLNTARVEDGEGIEISSMTWHTDAAAAQQSFPAEIDNLLKLPTTTKPVRCMSLPADQVAAVALLGKAAGSQLLDIHVPKNRDDGAVFRIDGDTSWLAIIMPCPDDGEGKEVRDALDGLANAVPGAEVSVAVGNGKPLKLTNPPKKKATKKRAAKKKPTRQPRA